MTAHSSHKPIRLVILISGVGSLMEAVVQQSQQGAIPCEVVAVGADRPCPGLAVAERLGIPTFLCDINDAASREEWDHTLTAQVESYDPDLVVSAGFMRIAGPRMVSTFAGRFINTHPALLPSFMGAHAVEEALEYGVKYTGSSIHLVDEGMDTGPLIAQEPVPVYPDDTRETLHERIKVVERRLLCSVLTTIAHQGADTLVTRRSEKRK